MTALVPHDSQQKWIDLFAQAETNGGILGLGTGVGKTLVSTEIARLRGAKRVLIMAPQSTFDSWASTVYWQTGRKLKRCANNAFSFMFTPDSNKRDESVEVKLPAKVCQANLQAAQAGAEGWFFVTRELFQRQDWKVEPMMKGGHPVRDKKGRPRTKHTRLGAWDKKGALPYDLVILDENQKFAGQGNYGQQSFGGLSGFKIASSADWFGSQVENMYTVARDVFGTDVINYSRAEWVEDYMETKYDHFAYTKKKVVGEQWPGMFASELPLYVTAPPSVEPPEHEPRYVTLSKAERELYDQLESNYVAMVDDEILSIEVPLTMRMRLRELSLGLFTAVRTGKFDDDGIEKITIDFEPGAKSSKLDEIKDILKDHEGEKFVIYTHSAKWARKAAIDLGADWASWTGDNTSSERAKIRRDFIQGDLRGFVATPETMGTGTDGLQAVCNNVIVASPSDMVISNTQGISRIARQGQEKQVNVWDIIARGTFDAGVIRRNGQKVATNTGAKGWG
ncbi:DNA helicase [Microbacterium Phage DejaVu]|nr:DNA helicase [Microbacterium phage Hubbs]WNM66212.1 DNA helicase [Microbacterium Phage DejaVu]